MVTDLLAWEIPQPWYVFLDKMAANSHTTLLDTFPWMKSFYLLIKISLKFVAKGPVDNKWALVKIMAWRRIGNKPLSEPMLTRFTDSTRGRWAVLIYWQFFQALFPGQMMKYQYIMNFPSIIMILSPHLLPSWCVVITLTNMDLLTHWGLNKMAEILQRTFSNT